MPNISISVEDNQNSFVGQTPEVASGSPDKDTPGQPQLYSPVVITSSKAKNKTYENLNQLGSITGKRYSF